MPKENNKMQVDIDTLKKQNVNDLLSIKELYGKLEELGEKITQIKYIDNTIVKKIKKEYENLNKIILDENIQVQLDNKINKFNLKLSHDIETINSHNSHLTNNIETINSQLDTKANEVEVVKKGYGTLNDFDEVTRNAIQGMDTTNINAVLGDRNVNPENTNFINIGKNLFDKNNNPMLEGVAITGDKNVSLVEQLNVSRWIMLEVGETYTISSLASTFFYIVEYDKKENIEVGKRTNFIKFTDTSTTATSNNYTFEAAGKYCLIVYWFENAIDTLQFEKSPSRTDYEEFKYILDKKINLILPNNNEDFSIFDLAYIKNRELICNNNFANSAGTVAKYTCVDLKENSKKVMCKAKFIGETSIALISMKNGYRKVEDVTNKSIHVVFGKTSVLVGYFVDNILTDVENVQYAQLTDNIEYSFGYELNGDNLTVYLPDGRNKVFNNSNWQQCNGQYVCWEHYTMNATTTNKNAFVKFTEFYTVGTNGEICKDNFNRLDGAIGIAPTGQTYSQYRNY